MPLISGSRGRKISFFSKIFPLFDPQTMAYSNNQYSGYQNQNQNYNQNYNQQYNNYCPYDSQAAAASSNALVSENYNSNSPYYPQSSYNNHDQNPFSSSNQVNSSNLNTPYQDYQDDGRTPELAAEAGSATMFDRPSDTGYVSSYPPNGSYGAGTGDNKSKKGWVIGGVIGLLASKSSFLNFSFLFCRFTFPLTLLLSTCCLTCHRILWLHLVFFHLQVIGIAAGLGYYFSHRDSSSSNSSSSNKGTKSTGDPSGFEKNSTYKQSFWGEYIKPIFRKLMSGRNHPILSFSPFFSLSLHSLFKAWPIVRLEVKSQKAVRIP